MYPFRRDKTGVRVSLVFISLAVRLYKFGHYYCTIASHVRLEFLAKLVRPRRASCLSRYKHSKRTEYIKLDMFRTESLWPLCACHCVETFAAAVETICHSSLKLCNTSMLFVSPTVFEWTSVTFYRPPSGPSTGECGSGESSHGGRENRFR